jgi:hypothetical protein
MFQIICQKIAIDMLRLGFDRGAYTTSNRRPLTTKQQVDYLINEDGK